MRTTDATASSDWRLSLGRSDPSENSKSFNLLSTRAFLWLAMALTMMATVSPPEDFGTGSVGTVTILPPQVLKASKLFARGFMALVAFGVIFASSYRRNVFNILLQFSGFLMFAMWGLCSVTWSALPSVSLVQAGTFGILILFGIAVACWIQSRQDTEFILKWICNFLIAIAIGLLCLRFAAPSYGASTRSSGGLFHSTGAGSTASLGIILISTCFFLWGWRWSALAFYLGAPVLLLTIIVSGNRLSLLLTMMLGSIVFLLFCGWKRKALGIALLSLCGITYLVVDPSATLVDRGLKKTGVLISQGQSRSELKTLSGRTEMWKEVLASFEKSPMRGHGYFVSSDTGKLYVWYVWGNWTAHSVYLQALVTTGFVGSFLLAAGVILICLNGLRLLNRVDPESRKLALLGAVLLLWYGGWGLLNSSILGPTLPESVIFFVVSGLVVGQASFAAPRRTP